MAAPMNFDLWTIMKISGAVIGCALTIFGLAIKSWDVISKRKDRREELRDKRRYDKELQLERDKVNLQKELEQQKQRHVQKLVDAIRSEMSKIGSEVKELSLNFARTDEKLKSNAETTGRNISMIKEFVASTNDRFNILQQEMKETKKFTQENIYGFRTKLVEINEDLILVKGIADKVKRNNKA